ncbi:MAG TPA: hypothetical protein VFP30_07915 [Candidatus Limnocylindria bacterium]|nr:hypothetical protein [Candidatus Limnocylindria bacterium]
MPRLRRRRGRGAEPTGGVVADHEQQYRSAWGLQPAQWRPVGSFFRVRHRAVLLWHTDTADASDLLLRVRRAYDRLGELGVTVAADSTRRGIEISLPLSRTSVALRILADRSILPDAVVVSDPPADQLRQLRRELGSIRRSVELLTGTGGVPDPIDELRARVRAE